MASLKGQKEAFVTGHEGTTAVEVFLICLSTPVGLALYRQALLRLAPDTSIFVRLLLECLFFIFPVILCQSTWLYPWGVSFLAFEVMLIFALAVAFPLPPTSSSLSLQETTASVAPSPRRRLGFITAYRASLLFLTFCAILAVDFPLFPRRLAKTEVFGYGLMDLGAASSIVAGGIMSSSSSITTTSAKPPKIRQWLIFIALGSLRLITHKNVEYQEHVSEYGLHWNFYFTLAFISISSSVISSRSTAASDQSSLAARISWFIPVLLLCLYQTALQFGLQDYIENASRRCPLNDDTTWLNLTNIPTLVRVCDLVAANREGVFGCVGYFFVWWTSQQIAKDCIWDSATPSAAAKANGTDSNTKTRRGNLTRLALISAMLWLLHTILVYGLGISVSRRTTNASFCVWTLAHNFSLLTMFSWVLGETEEHIDGRSLLPPMCVAVNRHGMPTFVVANLLTGLVNLSIPTLETSHTVALLILLSYLLVVGCLALALDIIPSLLGKSSRRSLQKQD